MRISDWSSDVCSSDLTALNLKPADIEVRLGEGVGLGGIDIATTPSLRMYTQFYADHEGKPAFPVDSAYDVLSGKLPLARYKDKIVLVGTTAAGTGDSRSEERRVGKEWVSTVRHRGSPKH